MYSDTQNSSPSIFLPAIRPCPHFPQNNPQSPRRVTYAFPPPPPVSRQPENTAERSSSKNCRLFGEPQKRALLPFVSPPVIRDVCWRKIHPLSHLEPLSPPLPPTLIRYSQRPLHVHSGGSEEGDFARRTPLDATNCGVNRLPRDILPSGSFSRLPFHLPCCSCKEAGSHPCDSLLAAHARCKLFPKSFQCNLQNLPQLCPDPNAPIPRRPHPNASTSLQGSRVNGSEPKLPNSV